MARSYSITITDADYGVEAEFSHYNDSGGRLEMRIEGEVVGGMQITPKQARQLAWWLNEFASDPGEPSYIDENDEDYLYNIKL